MGYRNYIGQINKLEYTKSKLANLEYLREMTTDLHEIGKYFDAPSFDVIDDVSDEDEEYMVITRDSLLALIKNYSDRHLAYLKSLKPESELSKESVYDNSNSIERFVRNQIRSWSDPEMLVYNLKGESLSSSFEFQYEVFDLIRIYKTFNEDKYYLVYRGS